MWTLFILSTAIVCCAAEIGSYDYDNKIEENGSKEENLTSNVYVLPEQIFNDGKPFYVKKDASGTIDFNAKTTPESLPVPTDVVSTQSTAVDSSVAPSSSNINITRKHDISLDNTVRAQNIHDYLNLPVKYQSSKFVYPLVSSSYANLKYQGNNKNFISNHKTADASTIKSVPYTTKKYKSTYPTKSYATTMATSKANSAESMETTTKTTAMPSSTTRKYSSIPPRSPTPTRRFSPNRISSTTQRSEYNKFTRGRSTTTTTTSTSTTTTTSTPKPIEASEVTSVVVSVSSESSEISSTISPNKANNVNDANNVNESETEPDSMFGNFFNYFFNDNNGETEATRPTTKATPSTTVMTLRPAVSSTNEPATTKENPPRHRPFNSRYNLTLDHSTRRPFNRSNIASEFRSTTLRPTTTTGDKIVFASTTASPVVAQYSENGSVNTGNFRPPSSMESIRVQPGAQTATFVANGQVSANQYGNVRPFNGPNLFNGQFQPPTQNDMKNIVVLPESNSASFVATSQLQTSTQHKPAPPSVDNVRRPVANLNTIDETTKPGITFFQKGQVTSAEAYDNPNQNKIIFHGPSASNSNNIVIAPGTQTAAFVTSSQLSMSANQPATKVQDQKIKNTENEINAYGVGMQASQRPHGFQLPSTTAIPKIVPNANGPTSDNETTQPQHIRFPTGDAENAENANKQSSAAQPETASLVANNTIKFPTNHVAQQSVQQAAQIVQQTAPVQDGLVKFTGDRNEITNNVDVTNYKQQIIQTPSVGNNNYVVFRPQPAMNLPQAPLVMGLTVPQIYRNPSFVFKKPAFVHYPRKNYTLPNILPQFRPTQPQQTISMSPEMVNQLRQGQLNRAQYLYNTQNLRYKTPMQILYSQRPMPIRTTSLDQMQNRRHFDLHPGNLNRIYEQRQPMLQSHVYNRNAIGSNALLIEPQRFEENMKVTAANGADNMDSSKNPDFENGDAKLQLAVQPIVESQKEPKVEPVTTLQMIQQQRLLQKTGAHAISANRNATAAVASVAAAAAAAAAAVSSSSSSIDANGRTDKPLYVVYPMQKSSMGNTPVNVMNRGNGEIATILAEQTQHKPATAQQLGLSYTMDKHKSRYILTGRPAYEFEKKSEQQQDPIAAITTDNDEEDSDRPIAIAYSPTEPNPSHLADVYRPTPAHQAAHQVAMHHSTPNVFMNVPNDDSSNSNQQFQAPFIPSINLENTQSTHNGWLIVTPPSNVVSGSSNSESKGNNRISASLVNANITSISRSDSDETAEKDASVESTTRKFDFDHFKPDFQSGFVPVYKNSGAVNTGNPSVSASAMTTARAPTPAPAPVVSSTASEQDDTAKVNASVDQKNSKAEEKSEFSLGSFFYDDNEDDDENDEEK